MKQPITVVIPATKYQLLILATAHTQTYITEVLKSEIKHTHTIIHKIKKWANRFLVRSSQKRRKEAF